MIVFFKKGVLVETNGFLSNPLYSQEITHGFCNQEHDL